MRRTLISLLLVLVLPLQAGIAAERWQTLPPTPAPVPGLHTGHAKLNGISLFYGEIGQGSPVVVLHGGLANSDYLSNQISRARQASSRGRGGQPRPRPQHARQPALLIRSHGRRRRGPARPAGIPKPSIVGWSDGGIIGLDLAIEYPARVDRLFAFGANTQTSGLKDGFDKNPVFAAYMARARKEYEKMSPTPDQYDAFQEQIGKMWADQPNWTDAQFSAIKSPVLVVDGDHDEGIKREHTEYIAATIPGAGLLWGGERALSGRFGFPHSNPRRVRCKHRL